MIGGLKTRLPLQVVTLRLVRNPSCSNSIGEYAPSASTPIHLKIHQVAETPAVPLVFVVSPPTLTPAKGDTCSWAWASDGGASSAAIRSNRVVSFISVSDGSRGRSAQRFPARGTPTYGNTSRNGTSLALTPSPSWALMPALKVGVSGVAPAITRNAMSTTS